MATTLLSDVWNSSLSSAGSEGPSVQSLPLYKVRMYVWYIAGPVILLLGNFGNTMTIIIMQKMTSGESVVNIYFTWLAVIDLITLNIFLLGDWIGITFLFRVQNQSNVLCKLFNWVVTGSTTISAWVLVGLTVHRALSVVWPHRVNLLCTRPRVIALLTGFTFFFAVVYSHNLYGYSLVYDDRRGVHRCRMTVTSYVVFMEHVFTYIDMVLYSLLPFACLTLANGVLVWKLRASVRATRHALAEGGVDQLQGRQKAARFVTLTVLLVSAAFIVLTMPSTVYYISIYLAVVTDRSMTLSYRAALYVIDAVTKMLMFCNNAVNFYLYCLTGQRFREEFLKIVSCGGATKPRGDPSLPEGSSKKATRRE